MNTRLQLQDLAGYQWVPFAQINVNSCRPPRRVSKTLKRGWVWVYNRLVPHSGLTMLQTQVGFNMGYVPSG